MVVEGMVEEVVEVEGVAEVEVEEVVVEVHDRMLFVWLGLGTV